MPRAHNESALSDEEKTEDSTLEKLERWATDSSKSLQGWRTWLGESGKEIKQFGWIPEIACPSENEIYVGELLNWRVQKLIWQPKK